ncbi:hypothetical protein STSP2_00395 [Anaerohalosphaera lusitana]|uniref:Uncharacterized protein n=1 Tax=Anaerohalosphaera lusitana TaxID=1936003 RepID=A0A1U9NH42_9BACT|nr:hypothetical protein STSP2_00395 [Anaerohalosphaera lusitana]
MGEEVGPIEEVSDLHEAESMVAMYDELIEKVRRQRG